MEIITKGADFSGLGLGKVPSAQDYITAANITDEAKRNAIIALYGSLRQSNLIQKLDVVKLYCWGDAAKEKFNLLDPRDTDDAHRTVWQNDIPEAHTTTGYDPNSATGVLADSKWPVSTYNIHLHVYNSTPETGSSVNLTLVGCLNSGNNLFIQLQRNRAGNPGALIGAYTGSSALVATGKSTQETGLLSVARATDNTTKIYSKGVLWATGVQATSGGIGNNIVEGNVSLTGSTSAGTACKLLITAYGRGNWTDEDEVSLSAAFEAFKTAIA